jgi:hypothetical protein
MTRAQQALLWAALIFPGAGHFHLKQFQRGIVLVVITLLSLSVLLFRIEQHATTLFEKLLTDGSGLDLQGIVGSLLHASAADPVLMYALWILALCWLFGMIDAYRLGKKPQH